MSNPPTPNDSLHDRASELLEGYVLDALDPAEAALVDEHLEEGCEDCEDEVGVLRRVAQALPLASRLVAPSDSLKERVHAALDRPLPDAAPQQEAGPTMIRRNGRPVPFWANRRLQAIAASIGIVAFGGLLAWAVVLQTQVDDLQDENVMLTEMLDTAADRLDDSIATALFSLAGENSSSLQFVSNDVEPQATARLIWDPDGEVFVLAAIGLDPTEEGSAYIAWLETPEGNVKLAHFYVGDSGSTLVEGSTSVHLADIKSMKITHESDAEINTPSRSAVLTFSR